MIASDFTFDFLAGWFFVYIFWPLFYLQKTPFSLTLPSCNVGFFI